MPARASFALRPSTFDRMMRGKYQREYFENSGYFNVGYWGTGAKSQREASDALVDQMVARIDNKKGWILDVGCGLGTSTMRLMQICDAEKITGINISEAQIAEARALVPDGTFEVMDATKLKFPSNHFDAVISIEAPSVFDTRDKFLEEALRVLKPGGSLAISDILFRNTILPVAPPANLITSIAEYRARLSAAGFVTIEAVDVTDHCIGAFRANLARWIDEQRRARRMNLPNSLAAALAYKLWDAFFVFSFKTYLLVSARKPA
jgi:MPBQ/MSBQ methyltransferase